MSRRSLGMLPTKRGTVTLSLFVGVFAIVGVVLLLTSRAATPVVSFEAENASLTGNVSSMQDTSASGGRGVKFGATASSTPIRTVFVVMVENRNWSGVFGSTEWPYLNNQLLTGSAGNVAWANNFNTGLHPSLPNYIAMEAANPEGLNGNGDAQPDSNPISDNHLTKELLTAGISWRYFGENLPGQGSSCFLNDAGSNTRKPYSLDHNPFVYFTDIQANSVCQEHIRPFQELCGALGYPSQNTQSAQWASPCTNTTASGAGSPSRYNFIVPNDWDQGEHLSTDTTAGGSAAMAMPPNSSYPNNGQGCGACQSDYYLSQIVPIIVNSSAYKNNNSVLFVMFDEADEGSNAPSGLIAISPYAKNGHASTIAYQGWGSYVRSLQEIFGVQPYINGANSATDLSDLFTVGL